jgi:predicted 3-demethylubiquinone-9 3-methyltransferase (glyoxalase superfamily)
MQKISPFLWFDDRAEEAAEFYVSLFNNSKIISKAYYAEGMALPAGTLMVVEFELDGVKFSALNGGPVYTFTPAISLVVDCETQDEVDQLWAKFTEEGEEVQCGWLVDKFGVSWQIVPRGLSALMSSPDRAAAQRATEAMLKMKKLDLAEMKRAFDDAG